jgi:hypothetical protein
MSAGTSVKAALVSPHQPSPVSTADEVGTLGTPKTELENGVRDVRDFPNDNSRTPRTGISQLRAYAREDEPTYIDIGVEQLKDLESGVRGVRSCGSEPPIVGGERLPFLMADGTLVIPFDSPERYHWWKPDGERLSLAETREEAKRRKNAVSV